MDLESLNFTELRDAEIVARMRKCNYEKFKTLVRMHLSFELDLNTDEFDLPCHEIVYEDKGKLKKWNRLSKKHKHGVMAAALATGSAGCASGGAGHKSAHGGNGNCDNGSPIEGLHQQIDAGFLFHLQELKEFLMLEKNLQQEGIFRKTGSASRQNDLRTQIQNDKPLELETAGYSAHDCATVFKGYLADLPEPLLTDAHYPAHLQIAPLCLGINHHLEQDKSTAGNNAERVKKELHVLNSIQLLLLLLPDENRQLLQNIIDMLHAVARQHEFNKMGPDNLATLFAPHLICPRNLPPEALHYLAKKMSSIIAYMIIRGQDIFSVPAKLATDIRAYFLERKRKKTMSPEMTLDDSISDISTVNTVYTFVDREKTAAAHNTNNTDTELAQLYAHIQSLPESSKKRRLIKQFNKQNGQGTPLQLQAMNRVKNSETSRTAKSLSDSIKKHIFHKGIMSRTPKRQPIPTVVLETPNNSSMKSHKQRVLFQSPNPQTYVTNSASINPNTTSTLTSNSTTTSSSSSVLTASINHSTNSHTPYNIKTHPLQKSISSSSLLMGQQYAMNIRAVANDEHDSVSLASAINSQHHSNSNSSNSVSSDGFVCLTKSLSAPVSRQTSSDLQHQINTSIISTSSSSSSLALTGGLPQHLDPNCCVTPLKLISEAAKQLIAGAGAGGPGVDKKSVAWDDAHLLDIEHISNPSTPLRQTPSNDLKSRYKSEPNLSLSHNICDTPNSSTPHAQGGYEMITPIAKHLTGRSLTRKLMKGVSMGNLKFPFSTPESTKRLVRTVSSTLKRRSSDDSQIYQQAEGSFAAAIRSGNAPLLQDMDDDDDDTFEDEASDSDTEVDSEGDDDNEDEHMHRDNNISLVAAGGGSNSSEVANCFAGGPTAYQQLLLQQSSLYHRNLDLVTSTPSLLLGRRSMSPITKSTQRMPKAMQESIMTPRSRKPVMVLTTTTSSTDQNQTINQTYLSDFHEQAEHNEDELEQAQDDVDDDVNENDNEDSILDNNTTAPPQLEIINEDATSLGGYSDIFKRQQLQQANQSFVQQHSVALGLSSDSDSQSNVPKDINSMERNTNDADALTEHFKEYLLTRSVLTAPPEDTSFTSHSDDFDSSHEIEELDDNQLSSSLLYCLDGNRPEVANDSNTTTTENFEDNEDDTTEDDSNSQTLSILKTATAVSSNSSSNSSSATSSSSSDSSNSCSSSSISSKGCSGPHIPLITTNRLANNPFVILNNARKRAATQDLEKISSKLFNSHAQSPNPSTTAHTSCHTKQLNSPTSSKPRVNYNFPTNSNSSSNKENCEQNENYVVSKKLLIKYLLTRSVLTAPPEDTSFTSHSDDFDSSHEIEELDDNQLSSSLLYCLDGNRPEVANDSNTTTTENFEDNEDDTTEDDSNSQTLSILKTATAVSSNSSSNSSSATSSSSSDSSNSCSSSSISSKSCSGPHIPLITTNRLANNPFVILNNARKRAATQDLEKISSKLFNSHAQSPNPSTTAHTSCHTKQLNSPTSSKPKVNYNFPTNSNSSSNKENCEQNENYVVSKKLLISEYPGETSF